MIPITQTKVVIKDSNGVFVQPEKDRKYGTGYRLMGWPWDTNWWKPTPGDRLREIAKAGALLAAEYDRLNGGGY